MKTLFLLCFFLILIGNASAKEKLTEKCEGFCVGEKLKIGTYQYPQPSQIIINGKKKKNPKWMITRSASKPKSPCIIFDSYIERAIPRKVKKKDFDKYMEDFRKGNEIFGASYNINSCRPCPAGMKPKKNNKTGYCPINMISLGIWYKNGFDKGYYPSEIIDFSKIGLGRDSNFDILTNLPNANNQVVYEYISFPMSIKKEVEFIRFKDKASGNLFYVYTFYTYKTAAKNQIRKQTQMDHVKDQRLIDFLDGYIEKMQRTYATVWDKNNKNFEDTSKLYGLIPNDNELSNFSNSFKEIASFHIQNRQ